jgi:hypothetical protein
MVSTSAGASDTQSLHDGIDDGIIEALPGSIIKYLKADGGLVNGAVVYAEGEDRTTAFVWYLVTAAAVGGLLFGYDVRF